jgi:SAM-dependent methyltransferase
MNRFFDWLVRAATAKKEALLGRERLGFLRFHRLFRNKLGLEIGGPSAIFRERDFLPVYPLALRIDGVNFATSTMWEGEIREGEHYRYAEGLCGRQFVCEASALTPIADQSYDFVLSSHSLEHSANPLKCLKEWKRVLRPGGTLLLVLPDARQTFDHRRPVATLEHLLEDCRKNTGEDDLTHLDEILSLHDASRDAGVGSIEEFRERALKNLENRGLHQHVFDGPLIDRMLAHCGFRRRYADAAPPFHLIALGTKSRRARHPDTDWP